MLRRSAILVASIIVLSLAIIGCGGGGGGGGGTANPAGPAAASIETASLSGTVLFNNAPLANASVFLYKSEKAPTIGMTQLSALRQSLIAQQMITDGAYSTNTNSAGVYSFNDIPVGQYTLIAVKDENHQFAQTGVLLGQVQTINPQLTPTGKIGGRVTTMVGATEQGVGGTFVFVSGTSYIALTDSAGYFVINNVPSNSLAGSTAYEVQVMPGKGSASPVTGVIVNPAETTNIGSIALSQQAASYKAVSGKFVIGAGATSADLAEQLVVLVSTVDGSLIGTSSNSDGTFSFLVSRLGSYYVIPTDSIFGFSPASQTVNVTALDNATINLADFVVSRMQAGGSAVSGMVTWPTVADWNFTEGEIIIEGTTTPGATFVDRRIIANQSTTPFRFDNVPPGNYTLRSNPLRNGYAGTTAAFAVTQGVNLTDRSLVTTFVAPFISTTTTANDQLSLSGTNFGTVMANLLAFVNDKPATIISISDTTVVLNIAQVPPGENIVQLVKIVPEGRITGNKKPFTRPVLAPLFASFNGSSTDTSITFNWQNAPYVNEVQVRLLHAGAQVRPPQKITGSTMTYDKLQPGITYTIEVISTYPSLPNSTPTTYPFGTKADGINSIPSFPFTGAGIATGTIFGFEVVGNTAYVGFDNSGPITIQSFNLTTNALISSSNIVTANSDQGMRSLAANSNGVFLTYGDISNGPSIAVFGTTLGAPITTSVLSSAFGLGAAPIMVTIRSLNNRLFVALKDSSDAKLFETNTSLAILQTATPVTTGQSIPGKSIDVCYDRLTNTVYVAILNESTEAEIIAFSAMNIAAPTPVGEFKIPSSSSNYIFGFAAENNQLFISTNDMSGNGVGQIIDATTGFARTFSQIQPTCYGLDLLNRIWVLNRTFSGAQLVQLDRNMNAQQSLRVFIPFHLDTYLPAIKLDTVSGNLYMLHFNASNQLAVYRYNSSY